MIAAKTQVFGLPFENSFTDIFGNTNLSSNDPAFVDGVFGRAAEGNGTSSILSYESTPQLNVGSSNFSISFWMQRTANLTGARFIVGKRVFGSGAQAGWSIRFNANNLGFIFDNGAGFNSYESGYTTPLNEWIYVTYTINRPNAELKIYVNTVEIANISLPSGTQSLDNSERLSVFGEFSRNANFFQGKLDSLQIFKSILPTTDIKRLFHGFHPISI